LLGKGGSIFLKVQRYEFLQSVKDTVYMYIYIYGTVPKEILELTFGRTTHRQHSKLLQSTHGMRMSPFEYDQTRMSVDQRVFTLCAFTDDFNTNTQSKNTAESEI